MAWLRLFVFAATAAAVSAASRPPLLDLADTARAQSPEFAADALLRIAAAPQITDIAWKRRAIEDAFEFAAAAQQPYARRSWNGTPASPFDKAYEQGLDACTLQCRAVDAMLEVDYKKAREMFSEIPAPQLPRLSCDDNLVWDVSIFYATAGEVAARAFNAKETANGDPFHLLQRYAADLTSPVEAAPVARMVAAASLKPARFEALVASFTGALQQLSGDPRSVAGTVAGDGNSAAIADLAAVCARHGMPAQPLLQAWRGFLVRSLGGTRCADTKLNAVQFFNGSMRMGVLQPIAADEMDSASLDGKAIPDGQCKSPECRALGKQFVALQVGPHGLAWTAAQRAQPDWDGRLRQFLSAMADWTSDDDEVERFQWTTRFYGLLFQMAPNNPDRDLLLTRLLAFLEQSPYQSDHRAEWFLPVNRLIFQAYSDPLGMRATIRELQKCPDPVISLYAQLERLLPRPAESLIELL